MLLVAFKQGFGVLVVAISLKINSLHDFIVAYAHSTQTRQLIDNKGEFHAFLRLASKTLALFLVFVAIASYLIKLFLAKTAPRVAKLHINFLLDNPTRQVKVKFFQQSLAEFLF